MLNKIYQRKFEDLELAKNRKKDLTKLKTIIDLLIEEKPLPRQYKDHKLKGEFSNCRECHIQPDWLLIYKVEYPNLILMRTGSHSDLF